jgi:hypothetical protein
MVLPGNFTRASEGNPQMPDATLFRVKAAWDPEAAVWVAASHDVPGLVAEAGTIEGLLADLRALIPDLLDLNCGGRPARIDVALTAEQSEAIERPA